MLANMCETLTALASAITLGLLALGEIPLPF